MCPVHNTHYRDTFAKFNGRKYGFDFSQVKELIKGLDQIQHPCRIDNKDSDNIPNQSFSIGPLQEMMSSFLHVVTETMFWDERTHLTEKIFKPIVAKQPFVLVGCANNLDYFRSYGFRTFGRWWDESYDAITDPVQRLEAVSNIIKSICKKSLGELEDMLQDMTEVLEHNYNLFYSTDFLDKAWAELASNFEKVNDKLIDWTKPDIGVPLPPIGRDQILEIRQNATSYEESLKTIAEVESQILSKT